MKLRAILFSVSACLVLAGAILALTKWSVAPYLFAVGSAGVAVNYLTTPVGDLDFKSGKTKSEREAKRKAIFTAKTKSASKIGSPASF